MNDGYITGQILENLISFLAPVVAIGLIIFCVIKAYGLFKGNEGASIKSLVIGVILFFFILGVMYAAGSFEKYGKAFSKFTGNAIEQIGDNADTIVGGGAAE